MNHALAKVGLVALALAGLSAVTAQGPQSAPAQPVFTPEGVVHVPAFDLPPSTLISPEAVAMQKARASFSAPAPLTGAGTIEERRAALETMFEGRVADMKALYPVDIVEQRIAGVRTRIVTPKDGEANKARVLINLHGGGFSTCAEGCAMVESIPVAALGRFKVVTVDYRQGPENVFPAASEDVASVYQELLKSYRPENIGIYGCSAGGTLTAEAVAWFDAHKIPQPAAIGIFGSGGVRFGSGDSAYIAGYIDASFPPPGPDGYTFPLPYFRTVKMNDRLVSPAAYPDIAAKFPPTLIITGTRAMDMSPAIYTHSQLLKAGVRSNLIVGEGMGHCYIYQAKLPEARDAMAQIVKFFDENLGRKGHSGGPAPVPVSAPVQQQRPARTEECYERNVSRGTNDKFAFKVKKKDCGQ